MLASFVEDAAHFPGGFAAGVAAPSSEAEVAALLRSAPAVLPIGAQSSLTGGATPNGEVVLSTARLNRILDRVRPRDCGAASGPGVTLVDLDAALARSGRYYPPVPTFTGAFAGGIVATNAAGAATFKYGTTRDWVKALTVVLPSGDVLDVERGRTVADRDGHFEIVLSDRAVRIRVPRYRMPDVPKLSAGYFAAPGMDLIDLFIGSEGTLGVITEVTLRVLPARPAMCLAFVPFDDRRAALAFVRRMRDAARETWRARDPLGPRRGGDRAHGCPVPGGAARGRRRPRARRRDPGTRGDGAARDARAAGGHDVGAGVRRDRPRAGAGRAGRRRWCASAAPSTKPASSIAWRSPCRAIARASSSSWRCAKRCRRASTRGSAARSSRSIHGSRRPPPT